MIVDDSLRRESTIIDYHAPFDQEFQNFTRNRCLSFSDYPIDLWPDVTPQIALSAFVEVLPLEEGIGL